MNTDTNPAQQNPQVQALLEQMHDIKPPGDIGLWPPAIGWWIAAILLITAIYFGYRGLMHYWRSRRYVKQALTALREIQQQENRMNDREVATAVIKLLKRAWFSARPSERHPVTSLYGRESLEALAKAAKPSVELAVIKTDLDAILYSAESSKLSLRRDLLFKFAEHWLKHHKRKQNPSVNTPPPMSSVNISTSAPAELTQGAKHAAV